jgi:hypothetical protein
MRNQKFFSSKMERIVTGYPTRGDLKSWDLDKARRTLGISGELPVLLVLGGSKVRAQSTGHCWVHYRSYWWRWKSYTLAVTWIGKKWKSEERKSL